MTRRAHLAVWFLALLFFASACRADGFGGSVGIASDEVLRGLTQSDHQLSPQLDLHYSLSGWYAGLSGVQVRRGFNYSANVGLIAYLGYQYRFNEDWGGLAVVRRYQYPGYQSRYDYDYDEAELTVSWRDRIVASVIASPDVYFADFEGNYGRGAAYCGELGGRQPLPHGFSLNAGLGYDEIHQQIGTGYAYGSAGISTQWRSWNLDLRYVATDATAKRRFEQFAENRIVFSVLWLF